MLEFDHIALTVTNLEGSINFYKVLGYKVETVFEEEDYRWASLLLGDTSLELFQIKNVPKYIMLPTILQMKKRQYRLQNH